MKKALLIPILALAASPAFGVITTFTVASDSLIIAGGADADGNFGGRNELINGDVNGQGRHMIMRWDVSSLTGLIGSVNSITIELDLNNTNRAAPTTAQTSTVQLISETDKAWVEGTGGNNLPPNDGVTWNNANNIGTVAWSGGPGLAGGTTIANIGILSIAGTESQGDTVSVTLGGTDLVALLNNWADDGAGSSGVLFRDDAASSGQQIFYDSKETAGSAGPRLIVNYEAIPEPSSSILGLGALSLLFLRRRR